MNKVGSAFAEGREEGQLDQFYICLENPLSHVVFKEINLSVEMSEKKRILVCLSLPLFFSTPDYTHRTL